MQNCRLLKFQFSNLLLLLETGEENKDKNPRLGARG